VREETHGVGKVKLIQLCTLSSLHLWSFSLRFHDSQHGIRSTLGRKMMIFPLPLSIQHTMKMKNSVLMKLSQLLKNSASHNRIVFGSFDSPIQPVSNPSIEPEFDGLSIKIGEISCVLVDSCSTHLWWRRFCVRCFATRWERCRFSHKSELRLDKDLLLLNFFFLQIYTTRVQAPNPPLEGDNISNTRDA